jgi:hypothetical protein
VAGVAVHLLHVVTCREAQARDPEPYRDVALSRGGSLTSWGEQSKG